MKQILEAIVGLEWGDEGKGKIVDERAAYAQSISPSKRTVVVRFQGGANAGHSLYVRDAQHALQKFVVHAAPSGLTTNSDIAIGPHVAFDPECFVNEVMQASKLFNYKGRIMISERVGILMEYHKLLDAWNETGTNAIGTTKSGIGPFYRDNAHRITRITAADYISKDFPSKLQAVLDAKKHELLMADITKNVTDYAEHLLSIHDPIRQQLASSIERLEYRLQDYVEQGNHIIIEGAQGTMLDVDMGSLPEVTSSHLLMPYAFPSLGLSRRDFKVYGVEKVYPTRVGNGALPTLATDSFANVSQDAGEVGATTGRRRRVGYPDWALIKRAVRLNDCDGIYITRVDCVQDRDMKACVGYRVGEEVIDEMPLDLSRLEPVYLNQAFRWHLWEGPKDLSDPLKVDQQLRKSRDMYVQGSRDDLPEGLQQYLFRHEAYINECLRNPCPIVGISIGPGRDETVMLMKEKQKTRRE
ncbi:MAG: adenylosuccinate synthetase [Nanoarchaeota archaeon]